MREMITEDGEIIEAVTNLPAPVDHSTMTALAKAEIDTQITTARTYPRSMKSAINDILSLATIDEETAEENIYALKRGGKVIRGPSIRLAEIISQCWGNCRVVAQVIGIDRVNKMLTAEGSFHDLQTNTMTKATVQRRISDSKGRLYNDDMIQTAGNAACSIAKRNAILGGVPKGIWKKAYEASEKIIRGDAVTLGERRDAAIKAFAHFGLQPAQVFQIMGVEGADDINLDDLVTMRGTFAALKNGETTVEELLRNVNPAAVQHAVISNPLKDDAPAKKPAAPASAAPEPPVEEATTLEDAAGSIAEPQGAETQSEATQEPAAPETPATDERNTSEAAAGANSAKPTPAAPKSSGAAGGQIKTLEEYRAHVAAWTKGLAPTEIGTRWNSKEEKSIRNKSNMTPDEIATIKAEVSALVTGARAAS